jgi:hypothetical protein
MNCVDLECDLLLRTAPSLGQPRPDPLFLCRAHSPGIAKIWRHAHAGRTRPAIDLISTDDTGFLHRDGSGVAPRRTAPSAVRHRPRQHRPSPYSSLSIRSPNLSETSARKAATRRPIDGCRGRSGRGGPTRRNAACGSDSIHYGWAALAEARPSGPFSCPVVSVLAGRAGRAPRESSEGSETVIRFIWEQWCGRYETRKGINSKGVFLWLCFGSAPLSALLALPRLCSRFLAMMRSCWVDSLSRTLEIATRRTASGDAGVSPIAVRHRRPLLRARRRRVHVTVSVKYARK